MNKTQIVAAKKFANIFYRLFGQHSIIKHLDLYFEQDFKGTKKEQLIYLFETYGEQTDELIKIVQEIINIHRNNIDVIESKLNEINDTLSVFGIWIDSSNMTVITKDPIKSSMTNIKQVVTTQLEEIMLNFPKIPADIKEFGEKMSYAYLLLYTLENFLRLFIDNVSSRVKITLNSDLTKKIRHRKNLERKNEYLAASKSSDLFYLDFPDLKTIILDNWDSTFCTYFLKKEFVTSKFEELRIIRNSVMHNVGIGDNNLRRLQTYFEDFITQLAPHF
ncbi:MAG: hypothetical protein KAU62_00685 [Candidatus Heimdallarchaeota archaeon]|nr:hypothetical protein [Candidatus Heimdallarchaeota archaeon]MCK4609648.1 hypothetical protein [Candidatus Heimdallarchaeota archaeon]